MNYSKIKQSIIIETISSIIELEVSKDQVVNYNCGLIYTLYKKMNKRIILGYTKEDIYISNLCSNYNYRLIGARKGTKLELNILEATLIELGHNKLSYNCYEYSRNLIKNLNTLGWPVDKISKEYKIKKSFH